MILVKVASGQLPFLVLRSSKRLTNEIDGFVRHAALQMLAITSGIASIWNAAWRAKTRFNVNCLVEWSSWV
ncbi:MAG: hypothetical protein LBE78_11875, partial [Burkholderiaceae bacterium]|nr:hypothetical protein [Burkholderiaceae bacterium]